MSRKHQRREQCGSGLDAKNSPPQVNENPTRRLRGGRFIVRESTFRSNTGKDLVNVSRRAVDAAYAAGVRYESAGIGGRESDPVVPSHRLCDFHQSVAPALLAGFDDRAAQAIECSRRRLHDASLGYQRNKLRSAKLGGFFHNPPLAISFWKRYSERERERKLAIDLIDGDHG
jgi:hypothetical protein